MDKATEAWSDFQVAQGGTQEGSSTKTSSLNQTFDRRILNQEKYNICTAISENAMTYKVGIGMICKDDERKLRRVWVVCQDRSLSNKAIEAEGIRSTMIKARDAAWNHVQILSSNNAVMDKLASRNYDDTNLANILEDNIKLSDLISKCYFTWIPRNCNTSTNNLATFASKVTAMVVG
ncbi:hypothetical protein ACH5RR_026042 [Cinchona calisaya]|uniref:RNase H type-1 domain-containing protein n=1 Tax=Cinchona calisaya TaxID=153742 RepID=A0ABD2Z4R5_9GENT